MPAGVSWFTYITFMSASLVSMFAGSQVVHSFYKPLQDSGDYLRRELDDLPPDLRAAVEEQIKKDGISF